MTLDDTIGKIEGNRNTLGKVFSGCRDLIDVFETQFGDCDLESLYEAVGHIENADNAFEDFLQQVV